MKKIIDRIEELRHNTDTIVSQVQECKIPAVYRLNAETQQTYFLDGQEYVYNGGKFILLIKNLPIYNDLKRNVFIDSMKSMVDKKEINPFLLFLDGKFIKWSDIDIVCDYKYKYLLINNFDMKSYYVSANRTIKTPTILEKWTKTSHGLLNKYPSEPTEIELWTGNDSSGGDALLYPIKSKSYVGILSNKQYEYYTHKSIFAIENNNDNNYGVTSFIIASNTDINGREHTISVVVSPGTETNGVSILGIPVRWMIVYNFNQPDQKILCNGNHLLYNKDPRPSEYVMKYETTVTVTRDSNIIKASCGQFNIQDIDPNTELVLDLNSDPLLEMFKGPKSYGYGCFQQDGVVFFNRVFINNRDRIVLPKSEMILLPFDIEYKENISIKDSTTIFAFDKDGLLVENFSEPCTVINSYNPFIYFESGYANDSKIQTNIDPKYKISKANPIIFKYGELYTGANITHHGLNIFSVDDGNNIQDSIIYKLFYYIYGNESKDNILNIANRQFLETQIMKDTVPLYTNMLLDSFDFSFDKNKSYEENIKNSLDYIMKYNPELMNKVYEDISNIDIDYYTGEDLLKLVNPSGYITMSRKSKGKLSNYVMIFVNGQLYNYHHHITYKGNSFTFPAKGLSQYNRVEILFFKNVDNRILDNNILSTNEANIYQLDPDIDISNLKIFSRDIYNKKFDVPHTDYLRYNVPFTAERISKDKINIILNDSFYYDRSLYFTSSRQFRYCYEIIKQDNVSKVNLSREFAYCNSKNSYMVFLNSKRMDQENYKITLIDKDVPFDTLSLYTNIPLKKDDKIEIFYVPDEMEEIYTKQEISSFSGFINIDKSKIAYNLSKNLYFIFLNGEKVPQNALVDVDSTTMRVINNMYSCRNLTIIKHVRDNEVLKELFKDNISKFDNALSNVPYMDSISLTGYSELNLYSGMSMKDNAINMNEIIEKMLKDYWLKPTTTNVNSDVLPDIISFEYDGTLPYDQKDSDGNTLITK